MADTTTELEVLDQIVDVLGGQSGQYETVVPTLQQILALLGGGGGGSGSGYNPSLSVGRADALTGADSTAQWAQRVTEGSGSATVRSVQGAAVVWNQILNPSYRTATANGVTIVYADGKATLSGSPTQANNFYITQNNISIVSGHKYIVFGGDRTRGVYLSIPGVGSAYPDTVYTAYSSTTTSQIVLSFLSTSDFTTPYECYPQLFDLTQMFGSGNEPQSVAEFEQMYPASYYPYSAPTLKPVQIAGIASTDAQGGELDSVEWTAQTLRAAGSVVDMLTAGELVTRVGVLVLTGNERLSAYNYSTYTGYIVDNVLPESGLRKAYSSSDFGSADSGTVLPNTIQFAWLGVNNTNLYLEWANCPYATAEDLTAWLQQRYAAGNPVTFFYELTTPTTQPISPALPMTYKVQQGGTESIIVPAGEISAAPLITLAEGESAAELVMDALAAIAAPDGPTATANHAVNTYLTMGGKLYKVTSAIAAGETIAAGTNVSETTVMAELIARTA